MRKLILIATIALVAVSCTSNNHTSTGVPSSPLIPLAAGYYWIYTDSVFNQNQGGALDSIYLDTVTVNSSVVEINGQNGPVTFYGITDPNGWFGNSYLGVDPTNTAAYGLDSVNGSPYTFFGTSTVDNALLGQSIDNTTNPSCPTTYALYGWASAFTVDTIPCLKNVQEAISCNSQILEQINTYIAPGTGVVRIEDYELDSLGTNLNKSFTMTLKAYNL
jgi:hypothetical protein